MVRGEPLQGPDRWPIVAELGVVVVLDDEPIGGARPLQQRSTAGGREHDAGRELMGGRDEHRVGSRLRERDDVDPVAVDGHGDDLDAGLPPGHDGVAQGGVFDREALLAVGDERRADDVEPLREALHHHQAPRARHDPARTAESLCQRRAQRFPSVVVAVVEAGVGAFRSARSSARGHSRRGTSVTSGVVDVKS